MLAGGQRQSCQRIVRMREYSTRATDSKGRAFGSDRATASTCSSGFLPLLHGAYLSFAVDIHALGAFCHRCRFEDASLRCPEDCRPPFGASRCRMPQTHRCRENDAARQRRCRSRLPAGAEGFRPEGRDGRHGRRRAFWLRHRPHGDARGACPSVESRLTTAPIVPSVARGLPDIAGVPAHEKL